MTAPVRWRDDESVPLARRDLLRKARGSRPMPEPVRARSSARVRRLMFLPAAAGLLLWMKSVAAAGLCVLGVVAAVHAVPALTRWVAPASDRAPAPSHPVGPRDARSRDVAPAVPVPEVTATEPPVTAPAAREPLSVPEQPSPVRTHRVPAAPEAIRADPNPGDPLAREAAMLEEARGSLSRNPAAALAIADRHAALFPAGALGIERELVAVQALQRLGRFAEARTRGTVLLEQARGSIYENRVKGMLDTPASP